MADNDINLADIPASIEKCDVLTYSQEPMNGYTESQAKDFIGVCQIRLMSALCMKELPTDETKLKAWPMLLANYVKACLAAAKSGIVPTASKSVRNFSISYGNNGKIVMSDFYNNFSDLLGMFNECQDIKFQTDVLWLQYAPDGLRPGDMWPDMPPGGLL